MGPHELETRVRKMVGFLFLLEEDRHGQGAKFQARPNGRSTVKARKSSMSRLVRRFLLGLSACSLLALPLVSSWTRVFPACGKSRERELSVVSRGRVDPSVLMSERTRLAAGRQLEFAAGASELSFERIRPLIEIARRVGSGEESVVRQDLETVRGMIDASDVVFVAEIHTANGAQRLLSNLLQREAVIGGTRLPLVLLEALQACQTAEVDDRRARGVPDWLVGSIVPTTLQATPDHEYRAIQDACVASGSLVVGTTAYCDPSGRREAQSEGRLSRIRNPVEWMDTLTEMTDDVILTTIARRSASTGRAFVLCGVGHALGERGLVGRLRSAGLRVLLLLSDVAEIDIAIIDRFGELPGVSWIRLDEGIYRPASVVERD